MLWAQGPVCPKCGVVGNAGKLNCVRTKPSMKNPEGKERHGLWKCRDCRKQFTVRIGAMFESSHIELKLWLQAIFLMTSSKKGISSHQLARTLGLTVKSAWFMSYRIREAMRNDGSVDFGSDGGVVEIDETSIGKQYEKPKGARGGDHKKKMLTLVDRTSGQAKSIVVKDLKVEILLPILRENIAEEAIVYTDEARRYSRLRDSFADHDFTTHSRGEYVRGDVQRTLLKAISVCLSAE